MTPDQKRIYDDLCRSFESLQATADDLLSPDEDLERRQESIESIAYFCECIERESKTLRGLFEVTA